MSVIPNGEAPGPGECQSCLNFRLSYRAPNGCKSYGRYLNKTFEIRRDKLIEIDIKEAHCPNCGVLVPDHYLIVGSKIRVVNVVTSWRPPLHVREYKEPLQLTESFLINVPQLGNCIWFTSLLEKTEYLAYTEYTLTKVEYLHSALYVTAEGLYITACETLSGSLCLVDQTGKTVPYTVLNQSESTSEVLNFERPGIKVHIKPDNTATCEIANQAGEFDRLNGLLANLPLD